MAKRIRELSYDAYLHPRWWPTWAGIGSLWAVGRLPIRLQQALGRGIGNLMHDLLPRRRDVTDTNLQLCFPALSESERAALLRKTFQANAIGLLECGTAWFNDPEKLRGVTRVHGLEHVHNALKDNRGVLLLGGHFSTLDLGGALVSLFLDFDVMQRDHNNKLFNAVMTRSREGRFGVALGRKDLRGLLRRLQMNRVVWYAPDQDYGRKNSVFAPFFGVPAATITATARIARSSGAAVIAISHFRRDDGSGYDIYFEPALSGYPLGDDVADATLTNAVLEAQIRRYPDQYLWMHRRFKSRPEGEADLYKFRKKRKRRKPQPARSPDAR